MDTNNGEGCRKVEDNVINNVAEIREDNNGDSRYVG